MCTRVETHAFRNAIVVRVLETQSTSFRGNNVYVHILIEEVYVYTRARFLVHAWRNIAVTVEILRESVSHLEIENV